VITYGIHRSLRSLLRFAAMYEEFAGGEREGRRRSARPGSAPCVLRQAQDEGFSSCHQGFPHPEPVEGRRAALHHVVVPYGSGAPRAFARAAMPAAKVLRPTCSRRPGSSASAASKLALHSTKVLLPSVTGLQVNVAR